MSTGRSRTDGISGAGPNGVAFVGGGYAAGQLWTTAWDGRDLGSVVLAALRETYVMVWPATPDDGRASSPAFRFPGPSSAWVAWPQAEAGMSPALLDRRLDTVLDDATVTSVRRAIRGMGEMPVETMPTRDDPDAEAALFGVVRTAQTLCDIEWPSLEAGEAVFNRSALAEHGLDPRRLHTLLGGTPGVVSALFTGERPPTLEQVRTVAKHLGLPAAELLALPDTVEADVLASPRRKSRVLTLAARLHWSEREARNNVLRRALLAARQSPATSRRSAEDRVDAAIESLLRET